MEARGRIDPNSTNSISKLQSPRDSIRHLFVLGDYSHVRLWERASSAVAHHSES